MNEQTATTGAAPEPPPADGNTPREPLPRVEIKQGANGSAQSWTAIVRLRKPVIANGETVSEISFREPTGGDIERVGNPTTLTYEQAGARMTLEAAVMTQMMALLAGVPPSTIRQMNTRDWNNAAYMLAGFFTPDHLV